MNNRRWWIAAGAAAGVLGAGVVAAAAIAGSQAKSHLQAAPLAWQAQWPLLKVVDQHYERGLFSSTHRFTLQWGCTAASATGAPLSVTLRQRIHHGPLPGWREVAAATIDTELVWPDAPGRPLAEPTDARAALRAHTVVGFGGGSVTSFSVPAFKTAAADGSQLAFGGMTAQVSESGGNVHYQWILPQLVFVQRDPRAAVELKLTDVRAQGELSGAGSVWMRPGRSETQLGGVQLGIAGAGPQLRVSLQQLTLASDNTLDKELLGMVTRLAGRGRINDTPLDAIELQASVKRLHAARYERLLQHVMDGAAACDVKQAASPQRVLSQVQQDLMGLLPFDPEIALDRLAVQSGGQRAELSYALAVSGVTAADAGQPLPAIALAKGRFKAEAHVPLQWVQQGMAGFGAAGGASEGAAAQDMAEVMLAKLASDGVVLREGGMLHARVSFDKGQWLINGKPPARPAAP